MSKPPVMIEADLRALAAGGMVDLDIAAKLGCHLKTVQRARAKWKIPPGSGEGSEYAMRRAREASQAASENAIPRGRGGDEAFAKLMGRNAFRDVVLRPQPRLPAGRLMS